MPDVDQKTQDESELEVEGLNGSDDGPEEDEEDEADEEIDPCDPCEGQRFEINREKAKKGWNYYWMLYAKNGKPLATNPVPYTRLNDLKQAIKAVADVSATAPTMRLY